MPNNDKEIKSNIKSQELKLYILIDEEESTRLCVRHNSRNKAIQDFCSELMMEDYWFFKKHSDRWKVETPTKDKYDIKDSPKEPQIADAKWCLIHNFYSRADWECDWCKKYKQLVSEDNKQCFCSDCL